MAFIMSQATQTKRSALTVIGAGLLASTLITAGLWILSDTQVFISNTNPATLRFRNLNTAWEPHRQLTLSIHQITILDETPTNSNDSDAALSFRFNFSRFSGNGRVETSSRIITAASREGAVITVHQNLPTASFTNMDERALFYAVDSDEALGVDVHLMSEQWNSGTRCPAEEGSQHYFKASDRFGLGAHTLSHRCNHSGFSVEYSVDYTIQEWDPQLTIREVWLGSSHNSGICYQAVNEGSTPSWYYKINVHVDSAESAQPIVSSPPLYPLKAGQEVAGCLGLPQLEGHARDSLRVELKQLYDGAAGKTKGGG
jgi:hypothetical protein